MKKGVLNTWYLPLVTVGALYLGLAAPAQSAPSAAAPPPPTAVQLQSAMEAVKSGVPRIAEFPGCLPAFQRPENVRLCVLKLQGSYDGFQEIPLRFSKGHWAVLLDKTGKPAETSAACAPVTFAQSALRRLRGDDNLRVTGEIDDGEGNFTDRRGTNRDRQGAYRLMCRYEVAKGAGQKELVIAYVWYDRSKYLIDADVEVWDDN
jgi:hypothetical protein